MAKNVVLLLGADVWIRGPEAWERHPVDGRMPAAQTIAQAFSSSPKDEPVLVYEPHGLAHQQVETPRVSRGVFASLERVQDDYPVVGSESLGWGIEPPMPAPGGTCATLIHFELNPGLLSVRNACTERGVRLRSVFSAFTAASAALRSRPETPSAALFLLPGFVAVALTGGSRRSMKAWAEAPSERDWKTVASLLGDPGSGALQSKGEGETRRVSVTVIAEGQPDEICPFWAELRDSGRISSVIGLDGLGAAAASLSPSHPANLAEVFPEARNLTVPLIFVGACGFALTLAFFISAFQIGRLYARQAREDSEEERRLAERVETLEGNRARIERLKESSPDAFKAVESKRHPSLLALSAAVPPSLVLTSLAVGEDGIFELEGRVVERDFDAEGARRTLSRAGFVPASGGWSFDKATGRLVIRGALAEAAP
jgi:hypothetical protein